MEISYCEAALGSPNKFLSLTLCKIVADTDDSGFLDLGFVQIKFVQCK